MLRLIFGILLVSIFIVWIEVDEDSLHNFISEEDCLLENSTALLYGVSSLLFLIIARRSKFLKRKEKILCYFFTIAWGLLMFIFCGEEISWGQRIFGIETPEFFRLYNTKNEINLHNFSFFSQYTEVVISAITLTAGLILPLCALTRGGKRLFQRFCLPVAPMDYWPLFVGAYIYGLCYYSGGLFTPGDIELIRDFVVSDDILEVSEFLFSVGMFCFALHGAIRPCALFRTCNPEEQ